MTILNRIARLEKALGTRKEVMLFINDGHIYNHQNACLLCGNTERMSSKICKNFLSESELAEFLRDKVGTLGYIILSQDDPYKDYDIELPSGLRPHLNWEGWENDTEFMEISDEAIE